MNTANSISPPSPTHVGTTATPLEDITLTIGVIGDPHVIVKEKANGTTSGYVAHSFFEVEDANGTITVTGDSLHPWSDLKKLIAKCEDDAGLKVDALLCVGDLGFRGKREPIQAAWKLLVEAGVLMNASVVASATGNHDVHSRSEADEVATNIVRNMENVKGVFETLRLLDPPYPIVKTSTGSSANAARIDRTTYFGEGASFHEFENFRLLIVNSCADHGHEKFEHERGNISRPTLNAIKEDLQRPETSTEKLNILIVHHPPASDSEHNSGSLDFVYRGDELLRILQDTGQPWLAIHGHKHNSGISLSNNTWIFSAASLGIRMESQTGGQRNQFYVLELTYSRAEACMKSIVRCWDWFQGRGWEPACPKDGGIFFKCGFGDSRTAVYWANQIKAATQQTTLPVPWDAIASSLPDIQYVTPATLLAIRSRLEQHEGIVIELDGSGFWESLAKKA